MTDTSRQSKDLDPQHTMSTKETTLQLTKPKKKKKKKKGKKHHHDEAQMDLPVLDRAILLPNGTSGPRVVKTENALSRSAVYDVNNLQQDHAARFIDNEITTSRYTIFNFLPKNLYEQFQQLTNIYFVFVGILQIIPEISTTEGIPTIYVPLLFVMGVSAIRAAFEDHMRHVEDDKENSKLYHVLRYDPYVAGGRWGFTQVESRNVLVGDYVLVDSNDTFPADLIMMHSAHKAGHCFVETSNLDGETNLKVKIAPPLLHLHLLGEEHMPHESIEERDERLTATLSQLKADLMWEGPNANLSQFAGWMRPNFTSSSVGFDATNILLRGTRLQNTEYVLGLVVYCGNDTKVRKNAAQQQQVVKIKSSVIRRVETYLVGMLLLQVCLCLAAALFAAVWTLLYKEDAWYLQITDDPADEGILRFFTWFIILSQLVPISLLVTGEFVKTFQAFFINRDLQMYHAATDRPAQVRSLFLNEDLGQIEYIFTDKTGTLTQNVMKFRTAIVGGVQWGSSETEISKRVRQKLTGTQVQQPPWTKLQASLTATTENQPKIGDVSYVNFDARKEMLDALWGDHQTSAERAHAKQLRRFLTHMAISNTITPVVDENGKTMLQASSPDELSLCEYAKYMGFFYSSRDPTTIQITKRGRGPYEEEQYTYVATLDFNSRRKRVTQIYVKDDVIHVMSKGADSSMFGIVAENPSNDAHKGSLSAQLDELSTKGLRTLVLAYAEKSTKWWSKWRSEYEFVKALPEKDNEANHTRGACAPACKICATFRKIERAAKMTLLGATAIDDGLQDLVPEAINDFLESSIKVWMLTGDKLQTAKNIGIACNLINPDMEVAGVEKWRENKLFTITGKAARIPSLGVDEQYAYFAVFDAAAQRCKSSRVVDQFKAFFEVIQLHKSVSRHQIRRGIQKLKMRSDIELAVSFEVFLQVMTALEVTMFQAVEAEVSQGLYVARVIEEKGSEEEFSMLVEGAALAALYPEFEKKSDTPTYSNPKNVGMLTQFQPRRDVVGVLADVDDIDPDKIAEDKRKQEELVLVRNKFYRLAAQCKSIVACRLTPYQKAQIIDEVQQRKGAVTLAIGDGANDEPMIKTAHVGVGIAGLEGSAAANASDYSIAQFRFLHTLLFVHGYWNYDRISTMVVYIFYKTIMMRLVMFWFGIFSGFSGEQFFNEFVGIYFNVAMTATPIMVLSTFDQRLSREMLEDSPEAYKSIIRGAFFNGRSFSGWIMRSVIHSVMIFYVGYYALGLPDVGSSDGKTHGRWLFSNVLFFVVVTVATFRICIEFTSITWIHQLFVWLSFFGSYAVIYIMTTFPELVPDLYGSMERAAGSNAAWFTWLLASSVPILLGILVKGIQRELFPTVSDVLQEQERLKLQRRAVKSTTQSRVNLLV